MFRNAQLFTLGEWRECARLAEFNVYRLAKLPQVSVCVRSLERLFKRKFGRPPSHFLILWRAEEARDWIIRTGDNNKQAASIFGFSDEAHLCHVFKQMFHRSPQSYSPIRLNWSDTNAVA